MDKASLWQRSLSILMIAFFLLGAFINILGPASIATEFSSWGYPAWFRYVTGALEIAVVGLLLARDIRILGIMSGVVIMLSAFVTLLINQEFLHAAAPAAVLLLLFLLWKAQPSKA